MEIYSNSIFWNTDMMLYIVMGAIGLSIAALAVWINLAGSIGNARTTPKGIKASKRYLPAAGIFGIIGLVGIFMLWSTHLRNRFYVFNGGTTPATVIIDGHSFEIIGGSHTQIDVCTEKGILELSILQNGKEFFSGRVLDRGAAILNCDAARVLMTEQMEYSADESFVVEQPKYKILLRPGFVIFDRDPRHQVFGFDKAAPATVSLKEHTSREIFYKLSAQTSDEFFAEFLEIGQATYPDRFIDSAQVWRNMEAYQTQINNM